MPITQDRLLRVYHAGTAIHQLYSALALQALDASAQFANGKITPQEFYERIVSAASGWEHLVARPESDLRIEWERYRTTHARNKRDRESRARREGRTLGLPAYNYSGKPQTLSVHQPPTYVRAPDHEADAIFGSSLTLHPESLVAPTPPPKPEPLPAHTPRDLMAEFTGLSSERQAEIDQFIADTEEQEARQKAILTKLAEPEVSQPPSERPSEE